MIMINIFRCNMRNKIRSLFSHNLVSFGGIAGIFQKAALLHTLDIISIEIFKNSNTD